MPQIARRLAFVVTALVAFGLLPEFAASAAAALFTDPAAQGLITLCDTTGHVMNSGSIYGKPFAWRAVGSTPAPKGYLGEGRTASLFAFQPIDQVDPSSWEGEFLTSGSRYTSATRPMAASSPADPTLADYLGDYPTKWNGLVQLRLFVGAPQMSTYTQHYDTATLRVTGSTWTLLAGGTTGCTTGTSTSAEDILPAVKTLPTPAPNAQSKPNSAPSSSNGGLAGSTSAGEPSTPAKSDGSSGDPTSTKPQAHRSSKSSDAVLLTVLAVVIVAGVVGIGFFRRRRPRGTQ